jgi:predicted DNA-binding transcriptional regulator AlpA
MNLSELLNEKKFHGDYGFSVSWQRKMRRTGGGPPFVKIGRMVRYRRSDIESYIAAHMVKSGESKEE